MDSPHGPESPYAVLGVDRSACLQEIRRAYLQLARVHHPDKAASLAGGCDDACTGGGHEDEAFRRIQSAYDLLRDAESRRRLDAHERQQELERAGAAARRLEVDLDEMDYEEEGEEKSGVWRYRCQCGDEYVLREHQLDAGITDVDCRSCSLVLHPLYRPAATSNEGDSVTEMVPEGTWVELEEEHESRRPASMIAACRADPHAALAPSAAPPALPCSPPCSPPNPSPSSSSPSLAAEAMMDALVFTAREASIEAGATYELVVPMDGREGGFIMYEHADNEP